LSGALLSGILALQMGAFAVVLETLCSGISELPFGTFVLLMQPIHLAIGIVEGLVTAVVVTFVWKARPEILDMAVAAESPARRSLRNVLAGLLVAAVITGGMLSWFASADPDGLEWSMSHTSGKEELEAPQYGLHAFLATLQEKIAFLPDYGFKLSEEKESATSGKEGTQNEAAKEEPWPAVSAGTSVSGLIGGIVTMVVVGLIGFGLHRYHRPE
jgi:cobalt/nickel transport system permease protein